MIHVKLKKYDLKILKIICKKYFIVMELFLNVIIYFAKNQKATKLKFSSSIVNVNSYVLFLIVINSN